MIYKGSCHCGDVAYSVEGELTGVMDCNCSICQRKAAKMWFVPRDKLRLATRSPTPPMVNVRCLADVDLDALPVKHFDGRKL